MRINVKDILAGEVGEQRSFTISSERPGLEDVVLSDDISGEVDVRKLEDILYLSGELTTALELECHRCLLQYSTPITLDFGAEFSERPSEDQWPIDRDGIIDITPVVRQEAILSIPIKQLCRPDCPGACPECGQLLEEGHRHEKIRNQ